MSPKIQNIIAASSIFCLMIILGCASFQEALTPCYIPPAAVEYADANETSILPWTTLFDARRVDMKMDFVHALCQITDRMNYEYLKGITRFHIAAAEELKTTLFSPTGAVGLLMTSALGGTAGALLLSKPGDKKKIKRLEKTNNAINP